MGVQVRVLRVSLLDVRLEQLRSGHLGDREAGVGRDHVAVVPHLDDDLPVRVAVVQPLQRDGHGLPRALAHRTHVARLVDGRLGSVREEAEDFEERRGGEGEVLRAQVARADDEPAVLLLARDDLGHEHLG